MVVVTMMMVTMAASSDCCYDTDLEELEGQIREVTSSIFQEILVKSVDAIPGRLKKMVVASGVHIEF
uniref:Uncharacterized protein n=1 Tax=Octopus bimaculoides TaxID=37653 RepID=A0A0L8HJ76_OCTBM